MLSWSAPARAAAALAAVCALAALAGCGGDDDSDAGPYPFYGVAPEGLQSPADYERMRAGGVGTVRAVLPWSADRGDEGQLRLGQH